MLSERERAGSDDVHPAHTLAPGLRAAVDDLDVTQAQLLSHVAHERAFAPISFNQDDLCVWKRDCER